MIPLIFFVALVGFSLAVVALSPRKIRLMISALVFNGLLLMVIAGRGIMTEAILIDETNGNGDILNNWPELLAIAVGLGCVIGAAVLVFKRHKS